ncbi:type I-F CRISPR-associated protein Csy1 [Gammaproteobacteria bacterium]|nr:type I-F CRISPR-associated protein Csy1 [Gammaproteobacteria bacterium]
MLKEFLKNHSMPSPVITEFLETKQQKFLKDKINSNTSAEDKLAYEQAATAKYAFANWVTDAATRARQLSMSSHPPKFVHPSAKASSIIADTPYAADGLLRSGNVKEVDPDIFGNASALDVEKFLRLKLADGKTIWQHIDQETATIQQEFTEANLDFASLKQQFLQIKNSDLQQSSSKLKQVYFPVADNYHLLSVLNPSGLLYKFKQKIDELRFSAENKQLRDEMKKTAPAPMKGKLQEIYDLTLIGYGGTQPQNISTLNSQNGGISYLLSSLPPLFNKRDVQPPKTEFFRECLASSRKWLKEDFDAFNNILQSYKNNKPIRDCRDQIILNVAGKVQWVMAQIRSNGNWSASSTYSNLPQWQKIWLDDQYADIRSDKEQNHNYQQQAQQHFALWFISDYKESFTNSKPLGDDYITHIKDILEPRAELLA